MTPPKTPSATSKPVEEPTIDWLIDQIVSQHSPLIDFNVQRLKALIKKQVLEAKENGFYMGCGVAGIDVYKVPELWERCSEALEGSGKPPAQNKDALQTNNKEKKQVEL